MESKIDITSDRLQNKIAIEFIEQHISKGKKLKLLDVGSADNIIKHYLPKNIEYYSLDLSKEEQDEELREYKHEFVLNLDKEKIPVKDEFFDIIVCLDVLEHTIYPEKVLEEFKRITKKDGIFIISIPNEYNFVHRIYYLFAIKTRGETPWKVVEMHQHIQKPRVKDIINLLSDNFEISKIQYLFMSRTSYKNKAFVFVDKFFNILAQIHPSLFAVNVITICKNKKMLKQKNKVDDFAIKNRPKYY
ncbi:class I SAM-dependent methyltransferase [Candidatus Pacearchaeota archaeon]|nr:class I SAM-dependent methyltransferase [Candidatus Pacearchaeota archaeon]